MMTSAHSSPKAAMSTGERGPDPHRREVQHLDDAEHTRHDLVGHCPLNQRHPGHPRDRVTEAEHGEHHDCERCSRPEPEDHEREAPECDADHERRAQSWDAREREGGDRAHEGTDSDGRVQEAYTTLAEPEQLH